MNQLYFYTTLQERCALLIGYSKTEGDALYESLSQGFTLYEADSLTDGIPLLLEQYQKFSFVLVDLTTLGEIGYQFLKDHQDELSLYAVPIIAIVPQGQIDHYLPCLDMGITDLIVTPYPIALVRNRIENIASIKETASMLTLLRHDKLTGLESKEFFYLFARMFIRCDSTLPYTLVCTDVQTLKYINERYSPERGSAVLQYLARELSNRLPSAVVKGRLSSDHFAFLLRGEPDAVQAEIATLEQPFSDAPVPNLVVKFGVYRVHDPELPISTMCGRARLALNKIKNCYGHAVSWYDDASRLEMLQRQAILDNMERALSEQHFKVYYQPKYDLKHNCTAGAEALVRWIHPELGFMNPGLFIPLFEQNGFISRLDYYIWEQICQTLQRWSQEGHRLLPISINVSRVDSDNPDLANVITELVDRYGVDHKLFHIEVTESASTDHPEQLISTIQTLHDRGFVIELDDFGSGYSSLSTLNTMKLDVLKLDMSLIRHDDLVSKQSVLTFAVKLAEWLNLAVVAEGVETKEQVERLRSLGCDYVQGYYYARPMPLQAFEAFLAEESARS